MACVSNPMRMKDFPFLLADTLSIFITQTSQQRCHMASSSVNITTQTLFGPFLLHFRRRWFQIQLVFFLFFSFFRCCGLAAEYNLHVLLPKAEDRERVDVWKRSRKQRVGCKIQHAIHTVTSEILLKNHNPKRKNGDRKMRWKLDYSLLSYYFLSLSVSSRASDHGPFFRLLLYISSLLQSFWLIQEK